MKFTIYDKKVKQMLQKLETNVSELDRVLLKTGLLVISSIKKRVIEHGTDLKDHIMFYKSEAYKKWRKEGRKKGKTKFSGGRQIAYKDLLITGRMWRSLIAENVVSGNVQKVKLFFGNSEANTKAFGNDKIQSFFGLGSEEMQVIDNASKAILKKVF